MRYGIHLSYLGKDYAGWQRQKNAHSVQEEIENTLSVLYKTKISLIGCGRTDAGVHAMNYYAHFDLDFEADISEQFVYHCNSILNKAIRVFSIFPVSDDWHARFSVQKRSYKYYISLNKNPFFVDYSWQVPYILDFEKMRQALGILLKYDDFTSFAKLHGGQKTNICKVFSVELLEIKNTLIFKITADRFLRNMIRAIVGTVVDIGRSYRTLDDFSEIIEKKDRAAAGASAPAQGLFLSSVIYNPPLAQQYVFDVKDFPYL